MPRSSLYLFLDELWTTHYRPSGWSALSLIKTAVMYAGLVEYTGKIGAFLHPMSFLDRHCFAFLLPLGCKSVCVVVSYHV